MRSILRPKALLSLKILFSRRDWIHEKFIRRIAISSFNFDKNGKNGKKEESDLPQSQEQKTIRVLDTEREKDVEQEDAKGLPFLRKGNIIMTPWYTGLADYEEQSRFQEKPMKKIKRVMKYDWTRLKERWKTFLGFEFTSELHKYYHGSTHTDVLIIGGGAMGSSCAYWLKEKLRGDFNVLVIEKDLTYRSNIGALSSEVLRQQFSLPENIEMSLYGADFLRWANKHLSVEGLPEVQINYEPYGYLTLASEEGAENLYENHRLQKSFGIRNVLLTAKKLESRFPWLKTEGIALGCLGLEKEGWFDPRMMMLGFKTKAISLGAEYVNAEVVGFQYKNPDQSLHYLDERFRTVKGVLVRRPNGECHVISFAYCVIAAGADSGFVAALAGLGLGNGVLSVPLPIDRRKHGLFHFYCPNGPGLNTPYTLDPSGINFRRNGLTGCYTAGAFFPSEEEESVEKASDNRDHQFFYDRVWPSLAKRVPSFKNVKMMSSLGYFREHNYFDMNGIVGRHPLFHNMFFACGFSGHGIQHAPAVGRAISELIYHGKFITIDLSRLNFSRFASSKTLLERSIS